MIYSHTATIDGNREAAEYAIATAANLQSTMATAALDAAVANGKCRLYGGYADLLSVEMACSAARELGELIEETIVLTESARTTEAAEQVATDRLDIWAAMEEISVVWEHTPEAGASEMGLLEEQLERIADRLERLDEALWSDRLALARLAGDGTETVTLPMWQVLKIATRLVYARPCGG